MATFMDLPEEVLAVSLENVSYAQMMNWCKSSPRFQVLCNDRTRMIGQLYSKKFREEVIGVVELVASSFDVEDYLGIRCILWNAQEKAPFKFSTVIIMQTTLDIAREIVAFDIASITDYAATAMWEINMGDFDGTIILDQEGDVQIEYGEGSNSISINIDLLKAIFKIALKLHRQDISENEGFVHILVDLSSVLQLYA